jgi:hypothetical protein
MSELLIAVALLAPQVADAVVLIVAASVSIWSRKAARRADGRRVLRLLRGEEPGS